MERILGTLFSAVMVGVISIAIMITTNTGWVVIDGWEIGVKQHGTKYEMEELEPGYTLFIPFYDKVTTINARPILFNYSERDANKKSTDEIRYSSMIHGVDKNGIPLDFALAIELRPIKNMMAEMFQSDGTFENGLDKKAIQPNRSIVRDVMGAFDAKTIQSKRDEVSKLLNDKIRKVYNDNKYFELVGTVDLKQIKLPKKVSDGQIEVQLAAQEAEKSAELIKKAENIAKSEAAKALGIANKRRIEAQGVADSILMKATAQAKANELLNATLTPALTDYKTKMLWDGKLPVVSGSDNGLIIDLKDVKNLK